ncbi:hypothetical protein QUF90_04185 [Desulfococcaceae bacterium HSG9]|nr:hypothetical protein [Desulfococcaceae bacterium HSG9]
MAKRETPYNKIIHLVFRGANGDVKQIANFLEVVKMVKKNMPNGEILAASLMYQRLNIPQGIARLLL